VTRGDCPIDKRRRLLRLRRFKARDEESRRHQLAEDGDRRGVRLVDERVAVEIQRVEEKRGDRQLVTQPIDVELSPNRRIVTWKMRRLVRPKGDRFAVEDDRARRQSRAMATTSGTASVTSRSVREYTFT
jgi:hypothetical protein